MFTEESFENVVIEYLKEIGYNYTHANNINRDSKEVLLLDKLEESLININKEIPQTSIKEAIRKIRTFETNDVFTNNKLFHKYLTEGVEVTDFVNGETVYNNVKLIDYDNIENNDFLVVNQLEIIEDDIKKIPDVIVYVNGIPLVCMELKSTSREEVDCEDAYKQLMNYKEVHIPSLFYYNAFLVISDGVNTKAGTITAPYDRFMAWKKINIEDEVIDTLGIDYKNLDTLLYGMFDKKRFLDIIKNFILFTPKGKIMAQYHQYYGMNKAIDSVEKAVDGDGRAGVVWHTQGSGKSFSMTFLAGNLVKNEKLNNPTIIVITDRNDLDGQLYNTFCSAHDFLRQEPIKCESRADVKEILDGRKTGGVVFSTIQKFVEETGLLSERNNIVVMVDEAHRTQYNIDGKLDLSTGEIKYGYAKYLREALPNATYIAFTGTPIESTDKSTYGVFGDLIDVYDMTQAVDDGATVKIYYESRLAKVKLDSYQMDLIDKEYYNMQVAEGVESYVVEQSQKQMSRMEQIICDEDRIRQVVKDIINHYEERENLVAGKAMIVAYSRTAAYMMYKEIIKQRPDYLNKVKMVMTTNNQDDDEMAKLIGTKKTQKEREDEFRSLDSDFKIVIVVDMWLTGFDVPYLDTMYIDKPMKAHNLMQAIARVNRVYPGKSGGLVVDYIGLKQELFEALKTYTNRDQDKIQENEEAKAIALDILEILRNEFHKFDYEDFFGDSDKVRYTLIRDGAEFVQSIEIRKNIFMEQSKKLKDVYKICTSLLSKREKDEVSFFIAVRSFIMKTTKKGIPDLKEVNSRISKMLEEAIMGDEVLVLTSAGSSESFDLLNDDNINKLRALPQKNIAANILMRVMKDKVEQVKQKNIVVSRAFSEKLQKIIEKYNNRNDEKDVFEVLEALIDFKHELLEAIESGDAMDLTYEEKAFFDVLTSDPEVIATMDDDILIKIAKDLTKTVKENMCPAWHERKQAQAKMRLHIKKLLKKYDYPPNKSAKAIEDVMEQVTLQCVSGM
ncbi:type I restriction endonuclease subunit R [Romboutsia hominis]|uniref:type I restriction endonuclease subunit R n=1 Tax=Romboutsia hominis TaxID=1507512 RepID=UPI001F0510C1|nr:type I restriction endonuclease subunit R [Romboutsia hominis]MCH1959923.1 type I restriction endonuclease subunit R [Romboutsia hominis]MCH1969654.1 type I restriction endonuclease subunit R [Romboutsia hominis]